MRKTVFSRATSVAVACAITFVSLQPTHARWRDNSSQLPGLESGKSIAAKTAILGGAVVGGWLLYKKLRNRGPASELHLPQAVEFTTGTGTTLAIENSGTQPVSVSEISLHGRGFEVRPTPLPLIVPAGGREEIPIRMIDTDSKARLVITYFEKGKERTGTVVLLPVPVASPY